MNKAIKRKLIIRYSIFVAIFVMLSLMSMERSSIDRSLPILSSDDIYSDSLGIRYVDGQPFNGVYRTFYSSGIIHENTAYQHGVKNGISLKFYPNGVLQSRRVYHHDQKEGVHQSWWANGNLRLEQHFVSGLNHGALKEYDQNGILYKHFQFHYGKEDGTQKIWGKAGKLISNFVTKNGRRYGLIGSKPCYTISKVGEPL